MNDWAWLPGVLGGGGTKWELRGKDVLKVFIGNIFSDLQQLLQVAVFLPQVIQNA